MQTDEFLAIFSLHEVPELNNKTLIRLLEQFGSGIELMKNYHTLAEQHHWIFEKAFTSKNLRRAEKILESSQAKNIRCCLITDPDYPFRLKQCGDAPVILYLKGNGNFQATKSIAIVGTRRCTDYGEDMCKDLVRRLSKVNDLLVVSGLADGIDQCAHSAACELGIPNVAVLGHGLQKVFPAHAHHLADKIQENGLLVSEYPFGTPVKSHHFPQRNRIVAGLCDVLVVIECPHRSGATISARLAFEYNRSVYAVPGNCLQNKSVGCLELIQKNIASVVVTPQKFIEELGWVDESQLDFQFPSISTAYPEDLNDTESQLLQFLQSKKCTYETLLQAGYDPSQLASLLLQFELKNYIKIGASGNIEVLVL